VSLSDDELAELNFLARQHDQLKPQLKELDDYYEGEQQLTYMHPDLVELVGDRIKPVIIAWPQLVVDVMDERLDVEGFRLPKATTDDEELTRVWQENGLDEESQLGHVDALVMRRSFVSVGTNDDDEATPLVTVESPLEMWARRDPRTGRVRAALRRYQEEASIVAPLAAQYGTLYLPGKTIWLEQAGAGWTEVDRDEHDLDDVAVVPVVNRARLADRKGRSELGPVLPLSDAANKIATDMMVAAEFHAIPLRGIFGIGPDDLVDQDGNKISALQAMLGRLLTIRDAEGKAFQFEASNLSNYHDSINSLAKLVASIAGIPPHYLGYATENPASADAIRSSESRLVKRAERKQRAFGGAWEQVMRLVRRFQDGGGTEDPKLRRLETRWRSATTPTVAQKADAAVKLYSTTPAPIVPLRQTRQDLGYSDTEISLMEAEDRRAANRAGIGALADFVAGPRPDRTPAPGPAPRGRTDSGLLLP
jgi:hypothetical protein